MATAQAVKAGISSEQSLALMKNMIRASISEICFLRNLFPSSCFRDCSFGNTTVKIIAAPSVADASGAEGEEPAAAVDAHQLQAWLEAAFDAIDRGYLRSIILGIYSAEERPEDRELLESYVYQVRYPAEGEVTMTLQADKGAFSVPRVREEAVTMIRSLIRLVQTMKPLHARRVVQLKLFYYDDRTPDTYQPTHFTDSTHSDHPFFSITPLKISVGSVTSRHHALTMKVAFREDLEGATDATTAAGGSARVGYVEEEVSTADDGDGHTAHAPIQPAMEMGEDDEGVRLKQAGSAESLGWWIPVAVSALATLPTTFTLRPFARAMQASRRESGSAVPIATVKRVLLLLQSRGVIRTLPGQRYQQLVHSPSASPNPGSRGGRRDAPHGTILPTPSPAQQLFAAAMVAGWDGCHTWSHPRRVTVTELSRLVPTSIALSKQLLKRWAAKGWVVTLPGKGHMLQVPATPAHRQALHTARAIMAAMARGVTAGGCARANPLTLHAEASGQGMGSAEPVVEVGFKRPRPLGPPPSGTSATPTPSKLARMASVDACSKEASVATCSRERGYARPVTTSWGRHRTVWTDAVPIQPSLPTTMAKGGPSASTLAPVHRCATIGMRRDAGGGVGGGDAGASNDGIWTFVA